MKIQTRKSKELTQKPGKLPRGHRNQRKGAEIGQVWDNMAAKAQPKKPIKPNQTKNKNNN